MASDSNPSSLRLDEHISMLRQCARLAKVIDDIEKSAHDDFADLRSQTLLSLHQSCLLMSQKLEASIRDIGTHVFLLWFSSILTTRPEQTIAASSDSAPISGRDSGVPEQASDLQPQPSTPHQSASVYEQGSHEAANVPHNATQQEMPEVDQTEHDSHQSASVSEQASHEAANVPHNAAPQETPAANEIESHNSDHLLSMSEQASHEAASVPHDAAPQESPKKDEQMGLRQFSPVSESSRHEAAKILKDAAQQEMPAADEEMDSYQSLFGPMESITILG